MTDSQKHVLFEAGTEPPGTGKYVHHNETGMYCCANCGNQLFSSRTKYESTMPGLIGWPSFSEAAHDESIVLRTDHSLGMERTEVVCAKCEGHLGHLFDDPVASNGKHYCINSLSLDFTPEDQQ